MDCKDYLCENCYASHKTLKAMRDHKIIPMEDILSGKVDITKEEENRYCKVHGKLREYYCKTEKKSLCRDCVILNECPAEHSRVSLKKASQILSDELNDLLQKSTDGLKRYEEAVVATKLIRKELEIHSQLGKESLKKAEKDCIDKVKKICQEFEAEIDGFKLKRMTELDQIEADLQSTIGKIKSVTEHTDRVLQTKSEFEIVSSHSNLVTQLQQLSQSKPTAADQTFRTVKFEAVTTTTPPITRQVIKDRTPGERWKLTGQFSTGQFDRPYGLALDQNDNIALCSYDKGVKVFSRDGQIRCTLYDSPGAVAVAVSPDNKYFSNPTGEMQIKTHDSNGKELSTTPITNVNNTPSKVNSVAVDPSGKIIVGQVKNTISIHNADGSLISKFATQSRPFRLAATSNGEIVSSFWDTELKRSTSVQRMDYSGGNVRVIQPPTEVKVWVPEFVCCREGEMFVTNICIGDPPGVYRYTSEGDYLGCVTTEVSSPLGIALSKDGMELFVADNTDNCVKIFQRL